LLHDVSQLFLTSIFIRTNVVCEEKVYPLIFHAPNSIM